MKKLLPVLLSGAMLLGLVGCGKGGADSSTAADRESAKSFPREKTLYLVGFEDSDPTSFNPLNDWPSWPVRPEFNLMYETLTSYNSMTGETEPLLGRHDETNDDYVSAILNPDARWSDGHPLTAEDVSFSFQMGIDYPSLPSSYVNGFLGKIVVDTIKTAIVSPQDSTETDTILEERIKFYVDKKKRNNPIVLEDLLSSISILPKHIFKPLFDAAGGDLSELQERRMDQKVDKSFTHIVSGPYTLYAYSNEKIVVKKRESYWGNKSLHNGTEPAPEYIIHPIYKGNDHANTALRHGEVDISSNFIPRIWFKIKKQKNIDGVKRGVKSWYDTLPYYIPGSIPMLVINTTKKPMDDKRFRRAMAFATNYGEIKRLAVSGYTPNISSGLILPFSEESKYFDKSEVKKYGASIFNLDKAKEILTTAGYKAIHDEKGNLVLTIGPDGDTLPTLFIKCPSGWSDFESAIRIAVKSMRSVGIDVREGFVDESLYWPAQHTGDFDIIMDTPSAKLSSSMPWARFESVMSSIGWRPLGDKMYVNIGRFNNPNSKDFIPQIDSLLTVIPHMKNDEDRAVAYKALNRYFMEEQPTIPVCYRPEEFYQFNDTHWSGFATEKDPYAPPHIPCGGVATKMLWKIKPVISKGGK